MSDDKDIHSYEITAVNVRVTVLLLTMCEVQWESRRTPTKYSSVVYDSRRFRRSSRDRRSCYVRKALIHIQNLRSHILDSHRIKAWQVFL
jgi:hypothetical protein